VNICVWNHDVQHTEGSRKPTTLHGLCFFHVFVNLFVFFLVLPTHGILHGEFKKPKKLNA